ncbi:hypothetical protein C8J57DRAFT_87719 [Mycena rebaudengoi]|nr:hypothetical protein C8J57DRAFT_87719 [Mycena rebaudengoi]
MLNVTSPLEAVQKPDFPKALLFGYTPGMKRYSEYLRHHRCDGHGGRRPRTLEESPPKSATPATAFWLCSKLDIGCKRRPAVSGHEDCFWWRRRLFVDHGRGRRKWSTRHRLCVLFLRLLPPRLVFLPFCKPLVRRQSRHLRVFIVVLRYRLLRLRLLVFSLLILLLCVLWSRVFRRLCCRPNYPCCAEQHLRSSVFVVGVLEFTDLTAALLYLMPPIIDTVMGRSDSPGVPVFRVPAQEHHLNLLHCGHR